MPTFKCGCQGSEHYDICPEHGEAQLTDVVVAFVDVAEPTDCYIIPIKFTGTWSKPD